MKNFYDLTDIKQFDVTIELVITRNLENSRLQIKLNDNEVRSTIIGTSLNYVCIEEKILISDPLKVDISLSDIDYDKGNPTVEIKSITVDNIQVMPNYNYTCKYENDKKINSPTNILEFNGTWTLDTVIPFKHWLHEVSGKGWLLQPNY